ncbi:MAG TPA: FAD-dependent oxidoreductase [Candidatus Paceibacterota bacterium]|nr:FAD-dependent oxidoreductase [Verrucomicrobiota bacterium]HSA12105.1 FAD-dependent oxidoreductase [Candidatus Paceibacterota bacterium]
MKNNDGSLTDAQLKAELERCEYCEEKPCKAACPADCSPADFIMAARMGAKSDYRRSGALIMGSNPLGWVCGVVCPDYFCMKACSRRTFDHPINIPAVQASVMKRAYEAGLGSFKAPRCNGKKVAVVGAGPAGLGAASLLAQRGYKVTVYEQRKRLGGMMKLIPDFRLDKHVPRRDLEFLKRLGAMDFQMGTAVSDPAALLETHQAVIVCAGLEEPMRLDIPGWEHALSWQQYLDRQQEIAVRGKRVAVLGGGAVAVDCATTARRRGALSVELIYRRRQQDMPLTAYERDMLLENGIEIASCSKPLAVVHKGKKVTGLRIARMMLPRGKAPRPENFVIHKKESPVFRQFDLVISAIGSRPRMPVKKVRGIFYAGDMILGSSTVVEAVATGKNAALEADAFLHGEKLPRFKNRAKSHAVLAGLELRPVPLDAEFFGRKIRSPFLLSAAPHTDGYEQMRKAYEAGWSGGVMKTAFDNVPIHIPAEYMTVFGPSTYGNCDNVSGHDLDRVCQEVGQLVSEFPDRLTLASTGGPVTGRDEADKAVWQSNTRKLEAAGAMGVEYSLSCPQGGDGTEGDIVSQNAELAARIIDWVMEASSEANPKLFKLTAAVTSIHPIIKRIQQVFAKYPNKKGGVTLANSFPSLALRPAQNRQWEEGVVVGMSGEGVLPISNLTLAKVSGMGVAVSGNGGPMNYKAAANFLALGAQTVQFCTIAMKYGLGIVNELHSGLSYLMEDRGFKSVKELIGAALPNPITDFMALPATKKLPRVDAELCQHCGNCTRCPYQAITLNGKKVPLFEPALCIGCSLCAQKCFAGAITMGARTTRELAALRH